MTDSLLHDVAENISNTRLPAPYRWHVAARCALAALGGFAWVSAFGALCATLFARAGWMPLAQGVHVMTLFGFAGWCAIAMWVFHQQRLPSVATRLLGSTLLFYVLFQLLR